MKIMTLLCAFGLTAVIFSKAAWCGEVSVAVAANFTGAAREIAARFAAATSHHAALSYGSTGKLYAQIANGAPYEVFLSADVDHAVKAEAEGLAVKGSRFTYARGRLVLWSVQPDAFQDGEAFIRGLASQRIALANPKTAPYGLAARQVLQRLGIWESAQSKLVFGDSVTQAFQFAGSANVEAAFVAYSQVQAWQGVPGTVWEIPTHLYTSIDQQAVLVSRGKDNPAARAFIDFLGGQTANAVIASFGYIVP